MPEADRTIVAKAIEIALTIPDNEARTALATLQSLGVAAHALERADCYRFEVEAGAFEELVATLRTLETAYNPNKHVLRVRDDASPVAGEVWVDESPVDERAHEPRAPVRLGGRTLPGVRKVERFTAWRIRDDGGRPARPEVVTHATEMLLCNPAFQRATHI